jgi:predicted ATPase
MEKIVIQGYKSIKDVEINFTPINILIGSNGSGKSNFLSFFEFLNNLYERKLAKYVALRGGENKMLHKGKEITSKISSQITFEEDVYSFEITAGDEGFIVTDETISHLNDPLRVEEQLTVYFKREANVKNASDSRAAEIKDSLSSLKKYHFHDTGSNSPLNNLSHVENDIYYLYERGENIAAFLYHIQKKDAIVYQRIVKTIQGIAPFFSDFYLNPNEEGYIRLQWTDKFSSTVYGTTDLSDGTVRFIALAALFMQPNLPSVVIIDEPELGLHPFAVAKLAGMIQSVAAKNVQVIIATQSADLINHFDAEDIITVDQNKGESTFTRLNKEALAEWLEEYSIGDLWQRNIIQGGQP